MDTFTPCITAINLRTHQTHLVRLMFLEIARNAGVFVSREISLLG
jgi:hypothetical protein